MSENHYSENTDPQDFFRNYISEHLEDLRGKEIDMNELYFELTRKDNENESVFSDRNDNINYMSSNQELILEAMNFHKENGWDIMGNALKKVSEGK